MTQMMVWSVCAIPQCMTQSLSQERRSGRGICCLPIRLQDEPCRDAEAVGSPTTSGTLTVHSEVQLKLDTTTTPRISGDLIVDAGQQRLGLAPWLEHQRQRRRTRPWSGQKTENCSRGPRGASASTSGWLWKNSNGVVAGGAAGGVDIGLPTPGTSGVFPPKDRRELREDDSVDSALVEFLNHRFHLGLQAWEGERPTAALLFFWPEIGRCGGRKIPRSWRSVKGWRRVTPGKQPQTASPHDVAGYAGRSWSAAVPADGRVRVSAPVRGSTCQRVAARGGRQRLQRSKTGTHDDSILLGQS